MLPWLLAALLLQQPQEPQKPPAPAPQPKKPEIVILDPNAPKGLDKEKEKEEKKDEPEELEPIKEYAYNPFQAQKEIEVGNFYMKKGRYAAAVKRYEEATKWQPNLGLAYLKLALACEKVGEPKRAIEAYRKFLEMFPRSRDADGVRKEIARLEKKKER